LEKSMMKALELTPEETAAAADIASSVPVLARGAFVNALAKILENKPAPYGPAVVNAAARAVAKELLARRDKAESREFGARLRVFWG
jgi:hypothetical protein